MKILVVDDRPSAADMLAQSLQALGWTGAGFAINSDAAVEWINHHGGCDVLVTEVFLQPTDGLLLRETIQPHLPGMKTIFTSIHDVSPYASRMVGCEFLPAPLTPEVLDSALRRLTAPVPSIPIVPRPAPTATPAPKPTATPTASPRPAATPRPTATPQPRPVAATPVAATPVAATPVAATPVA
ncbi:MAG: response regulator, partial [Chthoniobacterales bacterium]|nr:response regulator [Chthoniobacterales bacterium]